MRGLLRMRKRLNKHIKKIVAPVFAAALLAGCSMPDMSLTKDSFEGDSEEMIGDAGESLSADENIDATKEDKGTSSDSSADASTVADEDSDTDDNKVPVTDIADIPIYKIIGRYDTRHSDDDNKTLLLTTSFSSVMIIDDYKDEYPKLYEVLRQRADEGLETYTSDSESMYSEAAEHYESIKDSESPYNEDEFPSYYNDACDKVTRSDSRILSIVSENDSYAGGAHPYHYMVGVSFIVATGETIALSDVLTVSEDEFKKELKGRLEQQFEERDSTFVNPDDYLSHYKFSPDPDKMDDYTSEDYETDFNFYFAYDGVHVFFNVYEIASYAEGSFDVCFSYDESLINDDYKLVDGTGYMEPDDIASYKDATYKGADKMHFEYQDEGGTYSSSLTLVNGDSRDTLDVDVDPTILERGVYHVYTGDGREYIYAMCDDVNDMEVFAVFDITGGKVKAVDCFYRDGVWIDIDGDYEGSAIWTNPEKILLTNYGVGLGTFTYLTICHVGDDGMPVTDDEAYAIDDVVSDEITVTMAVPANIVENGEDTGKETTIPVGTVVVPIRCDDNSYIDVEADDGTIYRIYFSSLEYPGYINNKEVTEYFSGIVYVG